MQIPVSTACPRAHPAWLFILVTCLTLHTTHAFHSKPFSEVLDVIGRGYYPDAYNKLSGQTYNLLYSLGGCTAATQDEQTTLPLWTSPSDEMLTAFLYFPAGVSGSPWQFTWHSWDRQAVYKPDIVAPSDEEDIEMYEWQMDHSPRWSPTFFSPENMIDQGIPFPSILKQPRNLLDFMPTASTFVEYILNRQCKAQDQTAQYAFHKCSLSQYRTYEEEIFAYGMGASGMNYNYKFSVVKRVKADSHVPACLVCLPVVQDATCPAGMTPEAPLATVDGCVLKPSSARCTIPCAPGTWMSCAWVQATEECVYRPRRDVDIDNFRSWRMNNYNPLAPETAEATPINLLSDMPNVTLINGMCYPCNASAGRAHYGVTVGSSNERNAAFLSFFCPGGVAVPTDCPAGYVAPVDSAGRAALCVCRDGYYHSSASARCEVCPAGFLCTAQRNIAGDDQLDRCPENTFSLAGATACTPCSTATCYDPGYARTACKQVPTSPDAAYATDHQTQDSTCIPCGICLELGNTASDARPCYRLGAIAAYTRALP